MATDTSPVCFRLAADERRLMEAVARYQGETLSSFVRGAAINTARGIVAKVGPDAILSAVRKVAARNADQAQEQVKGLEDLFAQTPMPGQQH